jgi:4'-phosphopantetheinyl transferase
MPLTDYIVKNSHVRVGVWQIAEDEGYFMKKLPLTDAERADLETKRGHRRLEFLASRYLVQVMVGWAYHLEKDGFGKPYLANADYHISVSHSKEFTAFIIGKNLVGIDIQYITPRIETIAKRVMNEAKFNSLSEHNRLEHLHVYWGAKEALYKAYGKGELDFRKNILITPFLYQNREEGKFYGSIETADLKKDFTLYYKKIENYILVYAIEKK